MVLNAFILSSLSSRYCRVILVGTEYLNICSKQNLEPSKGAEHRNPHITVLCTFGTYLNGFSTNIEVLCTYKYYPT